jgi:hypothetical protein
VVIGIAIILLASGAFWNWVVRARHPANKHTPPDPDPRLTYDGPFENIHPDVQYVGDAKCAKCHKPIAKKYSEHPMGRSILSASEISAQLRFDEKAHNPFKGLETEFRLIRKDGQLLYRQTARDDKGDTIYESETPIDFALGSGNHGHSYLTNREGFVFQAPVSWFSQKQIWDASPGFPTEWRAGRPVASECLFCHSNQAQAMDGYPNRYAPAVFNGLSIGCERCHGPGERHVAKQNQKEAESGADYTIVNPLRLKPELRASICEQCHITGEARVVPRGRRLQDFRPGLPLEAFRSIVVMAKEPGAVRNAVNQVEQMYLSKCFDKSVEDPENGKSKLGCISCHDPHEHIGADKRVAHYRQRCLQCHQELPCSMEETKRKQTVKDDSCIDCHMPRYASEDIPHNASTDHRIPKWAGKIEAESTFKPKAEPGYVLFPEERIDAKNPEKQRDLGIGLSHVMGRNFAQGQRAPARLGRRTLELLNEAVRNDPTDWEAWEAKGKALTVLDRTDEAGEAYKTVLAKQPHREISIMGAAMSAHSLEKLDDAVDLWGKAVAENPWRASHRAAYAQVLRQLRRWPEARKQAEAWVGLDPPNIEARLLLVICLANEGNKARAREEFARIERLKPSNLPRLQARFAVEIGD